MNDITINPQYCRRADGEPDKSPCWDDSIDLFNRSLGDDYLTQDAVMEFLQTHSPSALYAAVTECIPVTCVGGVLIAELLLPELEQYIKTVGQDSEGTLVQYRRVGFLKALVVDSNYRRQGIGKALTLSALQQCRRWGCEAVLTIAWLPTDNRGSSLSLFEKLGFDLLTVIKNYWHRSSMIENFQCPACGNPPCQCDAAFLLYVFSNPV